VEAGGAGAQRGGVDPDVDVGGDGGLSAVLYALATNPDKWTRLRENPGLARVAFDEAVRCESSPGGAAVRPRRRPGPSGRQAGWTRTGMRSHARSVLLCGARRADDSRSPPGRRGR